MLSYCCKFSLVSGNPALRHGKPGSGFGLGYGLRFKSQFGHFQVDYAINGFQQKTVYFSISNIASWMSHYKFHTICASYKFPLEELLDYCSQSLMGWYSNSVYCLSFKYPISFGSSLHLTTVLRKWEVQEEILVSFLFRAYMISLFFLWKTEILNNNYTRF